MQALSGSQKQKAFFSRLTLTEQTNSIRNIWVGVYGNKLDIEYPILEFMENCDRRTITYTLLVSERDFILFRREL